MSDRPRYKSCVADENIPVPRLDVAKFTNEIEQILIDAGAEFPEECSHDCGLYHMAIERVVGMVMRAIEMAREEATQDTRDRIDNYMSDDDEHGWYFAGSVASGNCERGNP